MMALSVVPSSFISQCQRICCLKQMGRLQLHRPRIQFFTTTLSQSSQPAADDIKGSSDSHANNALHKPVCLSEAIDYLNPVDGKTYIDMTFGGGGHSREILHRAPGCRLVVLDRDPLAFDLTKKFVDDHSGSSITALCGRFSELPSLLKSHNVSPGTVDGFLFDVGASSMQFDNGHRGFSISRNGPLDMRMDAHRDPEQLTAADVVNNMEEHGLYKILKKYGEEKKAAQIARAVVDTRSSLGNIVSTRQLADIVGSVYDSDHRLDSIGRHAHVATKTFQALRIFVNNELNELYNGLEIAHKFLATGGRCVVISFHSLEDRIVKRVFHDIELDSKHNASLSDWRRTARVHDKETVQNVTHKRWRPINKVVVPSEQSIVENPRARSAKLRAAEKL